MSFLAIPLWLIIANKMFPNFYSFFCVLTIGRNFTRQILLRSGEKERLWKLMRGSLTGIGTTMLIKFEIFFRLRNVYGDKIYQQESLKREMQPHYRIILKSTWAHWLTFLVMDGLCILGFVTLICITWI